MICQDDTDSFLRTSKALTQYSDLCLQVVSSKFPGTITEWFEYPGERHFPPFFSFGVVPEDTPKDVEPEIDFSKLETRYLAIPTEPNPLRSKTTGMEGVLTFGWSIGLPEQAHRLILSRTSAELINQKVFFLPYERHLANDKLLSDLRFSKGLGFIPVYFDSLPMSESVESLLSATIALPSLSAEDREQRQFTEVKHSLLQLLFANKDSAQSCFNNFVFEVQELSRSSVSKHSMQTQLYLLQFPSPSDKELHVALVLTNRGTDS
ncbi:MAG: hypothetical protein AABO41_28495 [Acidobacteriota bacterium]